MDALAKRRAFGQHFLKDEALAKEIADRALDEVKKHGCKSLLEIGPGRGAITTPLLNGLLHHPPVEELILVEKDFKLADYWKHSSCPSVHYSVEEADFLDLSKKKWIKRPPLGVVSNLPYSAGTAILKVLLEERESIPVMVLMFQAEVARRLRADPRTKERGSLSLWVQNEWHVEKIFDVPPKCFSPPPKVDSEVVLITRRKTPQIPLATQNPKLWESLLQVCFAHRRKMLRSVFPWKNALEVSGVDGTKRAEALDWEEWAKLLQAVQAVHQTH